MGLRDLMGIRRLGTPTEETWPGVETDGQFKPTFPKWDRPSEGKIFPSLSSYCSDLLLRLLTYDPAARISAKAACEHPYIRETNSREV